MRESVSSIPAARRSRADETRRLRTAPAAAVLLVHLVLPVALVVAGLSQLGAGAISWTHAIAAGLVATLAFSLFEMALRSAAVARLDALELLPAVVAAVHNVPSRATVVGLHFGNGALFGVAWAYAAALLAWPANGTTGAVWGTVLWALACVLTAVARRAEHASREGDVRLPGPSSAAVTSSLAGHLVYGVVLGLFYAAGYPGGLPS